MKIFVYKITNSINEKVYIGQTRNVKQRWTEHKHRRRDYALYKDMTEYGVDKFKIEVIEEVSTIDEAKYKERYWISYYDSYSTGYNITRGGEDNPMYYDALRAKAGSKHIGIKPWLGKKHTKETKHKMSVSAKGRIRTESDKKKQSETRKRLCLGAKSGVDHFNSVQVAQIDSCTHEVIKIYGSINEAEKDINGKVTGNINRVIKQGKGSAFGYLWKTV